MPRRFVARGPGSQVNEIDQMNMLRRAGHAYRGMTEAEYRATVGAGQGVRSRGDYSFDFEGTSFAEDPGTAESYVNFGRDDPRKTGVPTYLVEVSAKNLKRDRDEYLKSREPQSPTRVWQMRADPAGRIVGGEVLVRSHVRRRPH